MIAAIQVCLALFAGEQESKLKGQMMAEEDELFLKVYDKIKRVGKCWIFEFHSLENRQPFVSFKNKSYSVRKVLFSRLIDYEGSLSKKKLTMQCGKHNCVSPYCAVISGKHIFVGDDIDLDIALGLDDIEVEKHVAKPVDVPAAIKRRADMSDATGPWVGLGQRKTKRGGLAK